MYMVEVPDPRPVYEHIDLAIAKSLATESTVLLIGNSSTERILQLFRSGKYGVVTHNARNVFSGDKNGRLWAVRVVENWSCGL